MTTSKKLGQTRWVELGRTFPESTSRLGGFWTSVDRVWPSSAQHRPHLDGFRPTSDRNHPQTKNGADFDRCLMTSSDQSRQTFNAVGNNCAFYGESIRLGPMSAAQDGTLAAPDGNDEIAEGVLGHEQPSSSLSAGASGTWWTPTPLHASTRLARHVCCPSSPRPCPLSSHRRLARRERRGGAAWIDASVAIGSKFSVVGSRLSSLVRSGLSLEEGPAAHSLSSLPARSWGTRGSGHALARTLGTILLFRSRAARMPPTRAPHVPLRRRSCPHGRCARPCLTGRMVHDWPNYTAILANLAQTRRVGAQL